MQTEYNLVRNICEGNVYINRYLEGLLEELGAITTIGEAVDEYLSEQIELNQYMNKTSEEYLNLVVAPNEFSIGNVQQYYEQTKSEALKMFGIGLGLQLGIQLISVGVEAGIRKAITAFKNTGVYNFQGSNNRFKVFGQRLKLAFKPRRPNLNFSPKTFRSKIKAKITNGMKSMFNKLKNPKNLVEGYFSGISKVQTALNTMSLASSAVMIYLENQQWSKIEMELRDTLEKYKKYSNELRAQEVLLNETDKNMTRVVVEQLNHFKAIAKNFSDGFDDTLNDTNILETFGEGSSVPLEGVELANLGEITNENVLAKQEQVKQAMKQAEFSMKIFRSFMEGFKVTLQIIKESVRKAESLPKIMDRIMNAFALNSLIKNHTNVFANVGKCVCALANLLPKQDTYQSLPLQPLRGPCLNPSNNVLTPEYIQTRINYGIKYVIQTSINETNNAGEADNMEKLLTDVNKLILYDPIIILAANRPLSFIKTNKRLMCEVAKAMPNKSEYYFMPLQQFRPNCGITDAQYTVLLHEAEGKFVTLAAIKGLQNAGVDPCTIPKFANSGVITCP